MSTYKYANDQTQRKQLAREADLDKLQKLIDEKKFDWEQRYDNIYILATARDLDFNKSRLHKAIETLNLSERMTKNKVQRFKDKEERKDAKSIRKSLNWKESSEEQQDTNLIHNLK